jgi:hypothetical protein
MTTSATINVQILLESGAYQKGMKEAGKAATDVSRKLQQLDGMLRRNSAVIGKFGEAMSQAGKKMTMMVSVPIIGFIALIIKKALQANTELSKLAKQSLARLYDAMARLGEKFLPLLIRVVDGLTAALDWFLNACAGYLFHPPGFFGNFVK